MAAGAWFGVGQLRLSTAAQRFARKILVSGRGRAQLSDLRAGNRWIYQTWICALARWTQSQNLVGARRQDAEHQGCLPVPSFCQRQCIGDRSPFKTFFSKSVSGRDLCKSTCRSRGAPRHKPSQTNGPALRLSRIAPARDEFCKSLWRTAWALQRPPFFNRSLEVSRLGLEHCPPTIVFDRVTS